MALHTILFAAVATAMFAGCGEKSSLEVTGWSVVNSISNRPVTAEAKRKRQKFVLVRSRIVGKVPWAKNADEQWNITKHGFTLTDEDGQNTQALYIGDAENMSGLGALMFFMKGDQDVELPEAAFMVSEDAIAKGSLKFSFVAFQPVPLSDTVRK